MEVTLTPDQQEFIRQAIAKGRLAREEDAMQEGLALWEERERQRSEFVNTLTEAKLSLARGEGRTITAESVRELAEEVHQRGLSRLASKQESSN